MNYAKQLIAEHKVAAILFSKPSCVQCNAMAKKLEKEAVSYQKVDTSQDPRAFEFVKSLNYAQVPVTYTKHDEHWGGYVPAKVEALAAVEVAA